MLVLLLNYLSQNTSWKVLPVFSYYSTRMGLAFTTALLLTILCGKPFIKKLYELKIGDRVRAEDCPLLGELHRDKNHTPTMGGILMLFSMFSALVLWMDFSDSFTWILLFTTVVMGSVGAYDDLLKLRYKNSKGLSGRYKLCIQMLLAALITLYLTVPVLHQAVAQYIHLAPPQAQEGGVVIQTHDYATRLYVPFFKRALGHLPIYLSFLFTMVVIAGSSNAVNLTDGLDGLATGTVLFAASAFALIAFISNNVALSSYLNILYIDGSGEVAIYLMAVAGACLGFLWYNSYPAQVFMGDTGSLTLGAILGVSAVLLRRECLLALIGGVFVLEALSVMIQVGTYKLCDKRRLFLCAPLHHHFEYKGWPETKVVARFWILGLLFAVMGVATLKFQ